MSTNICIISSTRIIGSNSELYKLVWIMQFSKHDTSYIQQGNKLREIHVYKVYSAVKLLARVQHIIYTKNEKKKRQYKEITVLASLVQLNV